MLWYVVAMLWYVVGTLIFFTFLRFLIVFYGIVCVSYDIVGYIQVERKKSHPFFGEKINSSRKKNSAGRNIVNFFHSMPFKCFFYKVMATEIFQTLLNFPKFANVGFANLDAYL